MLPPSLHAAPAPKPAAQKERPEERGGTLPAAVAALLLAGALLAGATLYGLRLERHSIHLVAWELAHEKDPEAEHVPGLMRLERIKNQGMGLQRRALLQPDLVSLYGSSELRKLIPDKAGIFFSHYPTGFSVFQVGKAGTTSLVLLQKIAAAMPASGPRHLALSLSSTWFLGQVEARYYAGNFSRQQALAVLFDPRLSWGLKHDLATRMMAFPETLKREPLLAWTSHTLAGGGWGERLLYELLRPLAAMQNAVYVGQDHFETAFYILEQRPHWESDIPRTTETPDWPALLEKAAAETTGKQEAAVALHDRHIGSEADYRQALELSAEWGDLELLLRACQEIGVEPLLLSMPPDGAHYEKMGVSRAALAEYSRRLHALCERYGVRLESFDEHVEDHAFLADSHDHMSVKGWMYYNQALDDYFHRRHRH